MQRPVTRYTNVGDAQVAYQVLGEGPVDIVFVLGMASNIDLFWEIVPFRRLFERFASFSRLILFDRRGTGSSDPVRLESLATWEDFAEDLRAVLDAAGSERAALFSGIDGGPVAMLFAAADPDRVSSLVITNCPGVGVANEELLSTFEELWGTEEMARIMAPSYAEDDATVRAIATSMRLSSTPATARAQMRYLAAQDVRRVLPSIRVPTLVLHSRDVIFIPPESSQFFADHIPGARFLEMEGGDALPFGAESEHVLDEVRSSSQASDQLARATERWLRSSLPTS
jgi:pimeloyl-ACP methyl ester carboxylesterase